MNSDEQKDAILKELEKALKFICEFFIGKFVDDFRLETLKGTTSATEFIPLTNREGKPRVITLFGKNAVNQNRNRSANADFLVRYGYFKADKSVVLENVKPFKSRPYINITVTDTDFIPLVINENEEGFDIEFANAETGMTPEFVMSVKGTRRPIFLREQAYMNLVKVIFLGALPFLFHKYSDKINTVFDAIKLSLLLWIFYPAKDWIERKF